MDNHGKYQLIWGSERKRAVSGQAVCQLVTGFWSRSNQQADNGIYLAALAAGRVRLT